VGGIVAFLQSVGAACRKFNPTRCVIVFDGKGGSARRRKIYSEYKEGRTPKAQKTYNRTYEHHQDNAEKDMKRQIGRLGLYMNALPVTTIIQDHVEADDVIAYICEAIFDSPENKTTIMSTDKDFLQLVKPGCRFYRPTKKELYTEKEVWEEYGVPPHNFTAYRAVLGDSSDNVPGVSHVGDKRFRGKFAELIKSEKRVKPDDIVEFAQKRSDESATYERVAEAGDVLERNFQLMELADGVDISSDRKSRIRDACAEPPKKMDQVRFRKLYMQDQLYDGMPQPKKFTSRRFMKLNRFATENNS
jgi:DNA polymerase-1